MANYVWSNTTSEELNFIFSHLHWWNLGFFASCPTDKWTWNLKRHLMREYITDLFCTYVCTEDLVSYLGVSYLCVRLYVIKYTSEYFFCYFKMIVVMRQQEKATHVMVGDQRLHRTSNNSCCFRSSQM